MLVLGLQKRGKGRGEHVGDRLRMRKCGGKTTKTKFQDMVYLRKQQIQKREKIAIRNRDLNPSDRSWQCWNWNAISEIMNQSHTMREKQEAYIVQEKQSPKHRKLI
jgi:hypothetical protein